MKTGTKQLQPVGRLWTSCRAEHGPTHKPAARANALTVLSPWPIQLSWDKAVAEGSTRLWRVVCGVSPQTSNHFFRIKRWANLVFTIRRRDAGRKHAGRVRSPIRNASLRLRARMKTRKAVGRVTPCAPLLVGFTTRAERRALPAEGGVLISLQGVNPGKSD
jgi:hypothetical protein